MKRLLLITLLCVGFAWGSENNASSYPKHWTEKDIKFYDEQKQIGFENIDIYIEWCNYGTGSNIRFCEFFKAQKRALLYYEANNKTKLKQAYKESCYWLMRMSNSEIANLSAYAWYDEDGYIKELLGMPDEIKTIIKSCAKIK